MLSPYKSHTTALFPIYHKFITLFLIIVQSKRNPVVIMDRTAFTYTSAYSSMHIRFSGIIASLISESFIPCSVCTFQNPARKMGKVVRFTHNGKRLLIQCPSPAFLVSAVFLFIFCPPRHHSV